MNDVPEFPLQERVVCMPSYHSGRVESGQPCTAEAYGRTLQLAAAADGPQQFGRLGSIYRGQLEELSC